MKKIIIACVAIAIATATQAATVDWKLQTGATYTGQSVYALTGTTADAVLSVCTGSDATAWSSLFEGATPFTVTGSNARAGATGVSNGIAAGENLVFVIVDGSVAEGSNYIVANTALIPSANVYEPPTTGTIWNTTLATVGTAGSGTFSASAVPEPTSGLLLLLGMAGLALKRKQA